MLENTHFSVHVLGLSIFSVGVMVTRGFSGDSVSKNLPANTGVVSSTHGLGRSPGRGNGNPLQYSCMGNPTDREAWRATAHGVAKELDVT